MTLYLLRSKDEVVSKLEEYVVSVFNKFEKKPKILRSDNGDKYTGEKCRAVLKKFSFAFQTSIQFSGEQNGVFVAQRKKWDYKIRQSILIGYSESSKGYRILDRDTNKIVM